MGWLFMYRPRGRTEAQWWEERFGAEYWSRCKAHATKNNVFYAVMEAHSPDDKQLVPDENGNVRYAIICLTKRCPKAADGLNWGYKDMSEFSGPNEVECPLKLLDMLSPLKPETQNAKWAQNWRDKCRLVGENQRAITTGGVYQLVDKVRFNDDVSEDTFICVERKGRRFRFKRKTDGRHVSLTRDCRNSLRVIITQPVGV